MRKWVLRLAFSTMWLLGAHLWHDMSIGPEICTAVGNIFSFGAVVLYIIAIAVLLDTVRYFKYWVESEVGKFN